VHYGRVRHTLAFMCAKNHLLIFSSFLDIWENVEWPRFFGPPCISFYKAVVIIKGSVFSKHAETLEMKSTLLSFLQWVHLSFPEE